MGFTADPTAGFTVAISMDGTPKLWRGLHVLSLIPDGTPELRDELLTENSI
jgi:hypothetical protein